MNIPFFFKNIQKGFPTPKSFPQILNMFFISQKITISAKGIEEHFNFKFIHLCMFYETHYSKEITYMSPYLVSLSN